MQCKLSDLFSNIAVCRTLIDSTPGLQAHFDDISSRSSAVLRTGILDLDEVSNLFFTTGIPADKIPDIRAKLLALLNKELYVHGTDGHTEAFSKAEYERILLENGEGEALAGEEIDREWNKAAASFKI